MTDRAQTLMDLLSGSIKTNNAITFIYNENTETNLSYKDLYDKALQLLGALQARGIKQGDKVMLVFEDIMSFVCAFWACIMGGIVPVPIAVLATDEGAHKFVKVWEKLRHSPVITDKENLAESLTTYTETKQINASLYEIKDKLIEFGDLSSCNIKGEMYKSTAGDIAFIQFSSGSTGDPKGVVLTHGNLTTNISSIIKGAQIDENDSTFSWMPLTHDMGIIGFHLVPLALGIRHFIMPSSLFIRRPILWLDKVNQKRASLISSPNFGLKYFADNFKAERAENWDLSCVRLIFNGAEPIDHEICNKFTELLSEFGLKRNAMFPVYGLAEASLAVTFPPVNEALRIITVKRESTKIWGKIEIADDYSSSIQFVDVGSPLDNCSIRICNKENNSLEDGTVGLIQIKGGSITKGYLDDSEKNMELLSADGWLTTGDLGFIRDGRLVVTGRLKDMVFVNGQNIYLHDIERIADINHEIGLNKIAACSVYNHKLKIDEIIIFVLFKKEPKHFTSLAINIKKKIYENTGINVKEVLPVIKIYKTTSGKIQRFKFSENYINHQYENISIEMDRLVKEAYSRNDKNITFKNDVEKTLYYICRNILQLTSIELEQNILDMGSDSLLLGKFILEADKIYPGKITMSDIFIYPTIRKLAIFIEGASEFHSNHCSFDSASTEEIVEQMCQGNLSPKEASYKIFNN